MARERQRLRRGWWVVRAVRVAALAVMVGVVAATGSEDLSVARGATVSVDVGRSDAVACPSWRRSASWSPARVLSGGGRQFGPSRLAVAPAGAAIAAWGPGVTVSYRRVGGRFGPGRRLAGRTEEPGELDEGGTQIAFVVGQPVVAWAAHVHGARPPRFQLHVAVLSLPRLRVRSRSVVEVDRYTSFALAGSPGASGLLAWSNGAEVVTADVTERGLGTRRALGFRPDLINPPLAAAIDPHGGINVAVGGWSAQNASPSLTLLTRAPGRAVVTDQMLLPSYPGALRVARDPDGATALLWQRVLAPSTGPGVVERRVIEGVARGPDGDLAGSTLSTLAQPTDPPGFAADPRETPIAVWPTRSTAVAARGRQRRGRRLGSPQDHPQDSAAPARASRRARPSRPRRCHVQRDVRCSRRSHRVRRSGASVQHVPDPCCSRLHTRAATAWGSIHTCAITELWSRRPRAERPAMLPIVVSTSA